MATPFDGNPTFRKVTYKAQWVINGVLVLLGAYFTATEPSIVDFPKWFLTISAVAPVLWAYLGVQADANTPATAPPRNEGGYVRRQANGLLHTIGLILVAVAVLLLVLALLGVYSTGVGIGGLLVVGIIGLALILLF